MAKYIVQHRRGSAAQWAAHDTVIPRAGEIVIEIDEDNFLHKLKIGDGVHKYAELAYLMAGDEIVTQVLAQAKPRIVTVELAETWTQDAEGKYSQVLTLNNITPYSRLDLQPTDDMLAEFKQLGLIFVTKNRGGTITVSSVGNIPLKSYTMQATIVETECVGQTEEIIGIPVGTPAAQSDWNQTDETKADYIKNKPQILTEEDILNLIGDNGDIVIQQIQPDWNQTDETKSDYIKNKPEILTEAALEIKADKTEVETALQGKVDKTIFDQEKSNINDTLNNLSYTLDQKVDENVFRNLYETHYTQINQLDDCKVDKTAFEDYKTSLSTTLNNNLNLKADKSVIDAKMDKTFGTSDQYAGFDGIAPNVIPVSPDTTPTENSTKLITSGAVYEALQDVGTGGNSGVYVGDGEMPENCVLQFDFTGKPVTLEEIANTVYTMAQSYIDEQLGVIENGSY